MVLSSKSKIEIDLWLSKFPNDKKRSAVMPALMILQKENYGYLTESIISIVAKYLNLTNIDVYEVATFYSMYELKPVGKYKICICTNISCMLLGSEKIVKYLQKKLGVGFNEITVDGKFSIKEVECLASCDGAPMMQIDDTYYENLTLNKIDSILQELN